MGRRKDRRRRGRKENGVEEDKKVGMGKEKRMRGVRRRRREEGSEVE